MEKETRTETVDGYEITYRQLSAKELRLAQAVAVSGARSIMMQADKLGIDADVYSATQQSILQAMWRTGAVSLDGAELTEEELHNAPNRVTRTIGALILQWSEEVSPFLRGRWSPKDTPTAETSSPAVGTTAAATDTQSVTGRPKVRRAKAAVKNTKKKKKVDK